MTALDPEATYNRGLSNFAALTTHERLVFLLMQFETLMDMEGWDDFFTSKWSPYYAFLKEGLRLAGDSDSVEILEDYEAHLRNQGVSLDPTALDAFLAAQGNTYFASCRDWRDDYAGLTERRWSKVSEYLRSQGIALRAKLPVRERHDLARMMDIDPDTAKTRKDILWGLYQEHRTHARHNESLRSNVNNYVVIASAAVIAVINVNGIERQDATLAMLLVLLGLVGALFSASYIERHHLYRQRALEIKAELDRLFFDEKQVTIAKLQARADDEHFRNRLHRFVHKCTSAHWLWLLFPVVILGAGLILTFLSLK